MKARIESTEPISFRLEVPIAELERLAEGKAAKALGLALEYDGTELVLGSAQGESALRFKLADERAVLAGLSLAKDEGAIFLESVLVPLMARYRGDLEIRLLWKEGLAERHGTLKITQGVLDRDQSSAGRGAHLPSGTGAAEVEPSEPEPPFTPEEREIQELLARARASWAEYQKAKSRK